MVAAGWSPSVRLFEAAACATPLISDRWPGIDEVLTSGKEILLVGTSRDVLSIVRDLPESERIALGERARSRTLAEHTSMHRAETLERYTRELFEDRSPRSGPPLRRRRARAAT
jgi:spore maturation protein CgeB